MKKKSSLLSIIGVLILAVAILWLVFVVFNPPQKILVADQNSGTPLLIAGGDIQPGTFNFENGTTLRQLFATVECRNVPLQWNIPQTGNMALDPNDKSEYTMMIDCPTWSGTQGCQLTISNAKCGLTQGQTQYKIGTAGWISFPNSGQDTAVTLNLKSDGKQEIRITCGLYGTTQAAPAYSIKWPKFKLYLDDPTGVVKMRGWLDGTDGCVLLSASPSSAWLSLQPDDEKETFKRWDPATSKPMTVMWEEFSTIGNINPLGIYQDYDNVICTPTELYEADPTIVNGKTYWVQGNQITNKIKDPQFCCGNPGMCDPGQTCANYKCEKDPQNVPCNYPAGKVMYTQCEENNGKFTLKEVTCGTDFFEKYSTKSVDCCPDYCARSFPDAQFCDYNTGCRAVKITEKCPDGMCCLPGHDRYETRKECPSGTKCCIGSIPADNLAGFCQTTCGPPICNNDGTCQAKNGETLFTCPADCGCNHDGKCDAGENSTCGDCVEDNTLMYAIIGILCGIVIYFLYTQYKPKRGKKK